MKTARETAHDHFVYKEGNGCEMVVRALASIGQKREHSERCDQDTAFLEARDAETAAMNLSLEVAGREARELLERWEKVSHDGYFRLGEDTRAFLASQKGTP